MGPFRRRDRVAPTVVIASPGGPTTSWPGRTMADQTFATVRPPDSWPPDWPRPGLTVGGTRLPGILVPSRTDRLVAKALAGEPAVFVVRHDYLAGEERDRPSYLGLGGRAMIFLNASARLCPDLDALGAALQQRGARLYVHAHRAGRYGFLRLDLVLPGLAYDLDTASSPVEGDLQEFLVVAHQTGVVELHISRESSGRTLSCACAATEFRSVVDRALTGLAGTAHPGTPDEQDTFAAELRSALPSANRGLDPAAAISLPVTDAAPSFVAVEVVR